MENQCILGCGRPGAFENQKRPGEFRCSKNISGCPAIVAKRRIKREKTEAIRAAEKAAKLAETLANPQPCACGKPGLFYSARYQRWRCFEKNTESFSCQATRDASQNTMLTKYGATHMAHIPGVQDLRRVILKEQHAARGEKGRKAIDLKRQSTMLKRYGVINAGQSADIRAQIEANNIEKYGVPHTLQVKEFRDKGIETNLERFGTRHPLQNAVVQAQKEATTLERWGVRNPMQHPDIYEKSFQTGITRLKEFTFPQSGKTVSIMGFEPVAVRYLLLNGFTEDDIVVERSSIPVIDYVLQGQPHVAFPDIFITSRQQIIEVKSTWTFTTSAEKLDRLPEVLDIFIRY